MATKDNNVLYWGCGVSLLASLDNWLLVLVGKTFSPLSLLSSFSSSPSYLFLFSPSSMLTSSIAPLSLFSLSAFSLIWLLVRTALHSSLGFFSVLAPKLSMDISANCLANWLTCTSRFLMANSVLLWFDRETYINWFKVSSSLVVFSYKLGLWLGGRLDETLWFLLKLFPRWDLQPWP